ncbi:hypothetical protein QYM36_018144 [Artemia franciscana]|uniref:Calponin-homology (CH) domain-containing protein n=1 Tax=Artemia franciscana TaxID=6661 RepID=A0AA88HD35_ARTSF|nr:hypothetical protein QYM36_018144 [Artemia franciscana]
MKKSLCFEIKKTPPHLKGATASKEETEPTQFVYLEPFKPQPKIVFSAQVGKSVSEDFKVVNSKGSEQQVTLTCTADFKVDPPTIKINPNGYGDFTVSWTPTESGIFKGHLAVSTSFGFKTQFPILGNAVEPPVKKGKTRRSSSLQKPLSSSSSVPRSLSLTRDSVKSKENLRPRSDSDITDRNPLPAVNLNCHQSEKKRNSSFEKREAFRSIVGGNLPPCNIVSTPPRRQTYRIALKNCNPIERPVIDSNLTAVVIPGSSGEIIADCGVERKYEDKAVIDNRCNLGLPPTPVISKVKQRLWNNETRTVSCNSKAIVGLQEQENAEKSNENACSKPGFVAPKTLPKVANLTKKGESLAVPVSVLDDTLTPFAPILCSSVKKDPKQIGNDQNLAIKPTTRIQIDFVNLEKLDLERSSNETFYSARSTETTCSKQSMDSDDEPHQENETFRHIPRAEKELNTQVSALPICESKGVNSELKFANEDLNLPAILAVDSTVVVVSKPGGNLEDSPVSSVSPIMDEENKIFIDKFDDSAVSQDCHVHAPEIESLPIIDLVPQLDLSVILEENETEKNFTFEKTSSRPTSSMGHVKNRTFDCESKGFDLPEASKEDYVTATPKDATSNIDKTHCYSEAPDALSDCKTLQGNDDNFNPSFDAGEKLSNFASVSNYPGLNSNSKDTNQGAGDPTHSSVAPAEFLSRSPILKVHKTESNIPVSFAEKELKEFPQSHQSNVKAPVIRTDVHITEVEDFSRGVLIDDKLHNTKASNHQNTILEIKNDGNQTMKIPATEFTFTISPPKIDSCRYSEDEAFTVNPPKLLGDKRGVVKPFPRALQCGKVKSTRKEFTFKNRKDHQVTLSASSSVTSLSSVDSDETGSSSSFRHRAASDISIGKKGNYSKSSDKSLDSGGLIYQRKTATDPRMGRKDSLFNTQEIQDMRKILNDIEAEYGEPDAANSGESIDISPRKRPALTRGLPFKKPRIMSSEMIYVTDDMSLEGFREVYYDKKASAKQANAFKIWLNYILTPEEEGVDFFGAVADGNLRAPTKEVLSMKNYTTIQNLNRLRREAFILYKSKEVRTILDKVKKEVKELRFAIRSDRPINLDFGLKTTFTQLLLNYNLFWLRLGLETIFGEVVNVQKDVHSSLKKFILERLLADPNLKEEYAHPSVPSLFRPGYEEATRFHTLTKFFYLVYFLDLAKEKRLVKHDPCLFVKSANIKKSSDILTAFSRDFLAGEGDVVKHLRAYGYKVNHEQKPIDEYDFAVKNLASDLSDGVRLSRVLEILLKRNDILKSLRQNVGTRINKLYNVKIVLQALSDAGKPIANVEPHHIAGCYMELILELLQHLMMEFELGPLLDINKLKNENLYLRKSLRVRAKGDDKAASGLKFIQSFDIKEADLELGDKATQLFLWTQLVCAHYGVKVYNFASSFSDGRALCYLIYHYQSDILQRNDISDETTLSFQRNLSDTCSFAIRKVIKPDSTTLNNLVKNEMKNFELFSEKLRAIGGVPPLLVASDVIQTLPEKSVIAAFIGFLCVRLTNLSEEMQAARKIQLWWCQIMAKKREKELVIQVSAAAKIQRWYRNHLEKARQKRRLELERAKEAAAIVVQRYARRFLAKKKLDILKKDKIRKENEAILNKCATKIQCYWRRHSAKNVLLRLKTERVARRNASAIKIQSAWRAHQAKKRLAVLKKSRAEENAAAVVIQSTWRRFTARKRLMGLKSQRANEVAAAIKIQSVWRSYKARQRVTMLRETRVQKYLAAVIIQRAFRCLVARIKLSKLKSQRANEVAAATKIQSVWRSYKARQRVAMHREARVREYFAAATIQQAWRGFAARIKLSKLKSQRANEIAAATKIQSVWRCYKARQRVAVLKEARAHEHLAAVTIQRAFRSFVARIKLSKLKYQRNNEVVAATKIQSVWRSFKAKQTVAILRKARIHEYSAAVTIQCAWRSFTARTKLMELKSQRDNEVVAAIKIQSAWRSFKARRRVADLRKTRIQERSAAAFWRGYLVRKSNPKKLQDIRERVGNTVASQQQTLGARTKSAIEFIFKLSSLDLMKEALINLSVSTKLSSVCCNILVAERGVEKLCELIFQTNKSLPAIENICYALDILTHLAIFEETRSSLVTQPEVVKTLLSTIVRFKQNNEPVFTRACHLVTLLASFPELRIALLSHQEYKRVLTLKSEIQKEKLKPKKSADDALFKAPLTRSRTERELPSMIRKSEELMPRRSLSRSKTERELPSMTEKRQEVILRRSLSRSRTERELPSMTSKEQKVIPRRSLSRSKNERELPSVVITVSSEDAKPQESLLRSRTERELPSTTMQQEAEPRTLTSASTTEHDFSLVTKEQDATPRRSLSRSRVEKRTDGRRHSVAEMPCTPIGTRVRRVLNAPEINRQLLADAHVQILAPPLNLRRSVSNSNVRGIKFVIAPYWKLKRHEQVVKVPESQVEALKKLFQKLE